MFIIVKSDGEPGSGAYLDVYGPFPDRKAAESELPADTEDEFFSVHELQDASKLFGDENL